MHPIDDAPASAYRGRAWINPIQNPLHIMFGTRAPGTNAATAAYGAWPPCTAGGMPAAPSGRTAFSRVAPGRRQRPAPATVAQNAASPARRGPLAPPSIASLPVASSTRAAPQRGPRSTSARVPPPAGATYFGTRLAGLAAWSPSDAARSTPGAAPSPIGPLAGSAALGGRGGQHGEGEEEEEEQGAEEREAAGLALEDLPPELMAQIVGRLSYSDLAAAVRSGRSLGLAALDVRDRAVRRLTAPGGACAYLDDCLSAALVAIAADDAVTLRLLLDTGVLNVNAPFPLGTVTSGRRHPIFIDRVLATGYSPRSQRLLDLYGYTTLLEQAAGALAPKSIDLLVRAGALPWPYMETPLVAAIGTLFPNRVTVSIGDDPYDPFLSHMTGTQPVRREEGVDVVHVVNTLLRRFPRSPALDALTLNPLNRVYEAAQATARRGGSLPGTHAAADVAARLATRLIEAGYSPSEPVFESARMGIRNYENAHQIVADRSGTMEGPIERALGDVYRRWSDERPPGSDERDRARAEAGRASTERVQDAAVALDVSPLGDAPLPEPARRAFVALGGDRIRKSIGNDARPLLMRPPPSTLLRRAVDMLRASAIRTMLASGYGAWPTREALLNGLITEYGTRCLLDEVGPLVPGAPPDDVLATVDALLSDAERTRPLDFWDVNPLTVARNALVYAAIAPANTPDRALANQNVAAYMYDIVGRLLEAGYSPDERATAAPFPPADWAVPVIASGSWPTSFGAAALAYRRSDERAYAGAPLTERQLAERGLRDLEGLAAAQPAAATLRCVLDLYDRHSDPAASL